MVEQHQVTWRKQHIPYPDTGRQNGLTREWILPHDRWMDGIWPRIRQELASYLAATGVQPHRGVHNLKSSWVLCANLYFAARQDKQLLADFLHETVSPEIETVDQIELEYAEEGDLAPSKLLGEPQGVRGANQTSPDVAFIVNGGRGLILTENKFTEHSFYECSGRNPKYGNPDRNRCLNLADVLGNPHQICFQTHWAEDRRTNRRYWDYLQITEYGREHLRHCPAALGGYQLFRQQALAEGIAKSGKYDFVYSCVAYDARYETLITSLKSAGIPDFRIGWGQLFSGKAKFASFSHQQWTTWVRQYNSNNQWTDWLKYINLRYGFIIKG